MIARRGLDAALMNTRSCCNLSLKKKEHGCSCPQLLQLSSKRAVVLGRYCWLAASLAACAVDCCWLLWSLAVLFSVLGACSADCAGVLVQVGWGLLLEPVRPRLAVPFAWA